MLWIFGDYDEGEGGGDGGGSFGEERVGGR